MGGVGSGGHRNSGKTSNAEKERREAEKQGRTLAQLWKNQTKNAAELGAHELLNNSIVHAEEITESKHDESLEIADAPRDNVLLDDESSECDENDDVVSDYDSELDADDSRTVNSNENHEDEADPSLPNTYITDLTDVIKRNFETKTGYYTEFMKGNFFVYAPNPLSRMKIAHNNIYPDTFFAKDLFIWCPLTSFPEFNYVCIVEGCKGSLKKEGWPSDPAARRVYSLGNSYYIFARQYCCKRCNKKFLATNPEFMQSLPIYVQELFPAFMTHRSGIDKGLLNFIFSLLGEGNPISGLRNTLKEIFYLNYDRKRFQYYSYCRDLIIGSSLRNSGSLSLNLRETVIVHKFGQISSKNGYNEYIPSVNILILFS
jgi:hypothetical protein